MARTVKAKKQKVPNFDKELYCYDDQVHIGFVNRYHQYWVKNPDISEEYLKKHSISQVGKTIVHKEALIDWSINVTIDRALEIVDEYDTDDDDTLLLTFEQLETILVRAKRERFKVIKKAGDIGSEVHEAVEELLEYPDLARPSLSTEEARKGYMGVKRWYNSHKPHVVASEYPVYSKLLDIVGMLDFITEEDDLDGLCITDLKTSNGIYPEHHLQVGGYAYCWNEMYPDEPIKHARILWVDKKTGGFEVIPVKLHLMMGLFEGCVPLFHYLKALET